jgi:argininosuccinate lyase
LTELVHAHPSLGAEALSVLEPGVAVTRRTSPGGAGPVPFSVQLERFRQRLELDSQRVSHAREHQVRHGSGAGSAGSGVAASGGGSEAGADCSGR